MGMHITKILKTTHYRSKHKCLQLLNSTFASKDLQNKIYNKRYIYKLNISKKICYLYMTFVDKKLHCLFTKQKFTDTKFIKTINKIRTSIQYAIFFFPIKAIEKLHVSFPLILSIRLKKIYMALKCLINDHLRNTLNRITNNSNNLLEF